MADLRYLKRWRLPAHYFGETWPDYYSAGVGQSRDSDCLEQSNFAVMLERLGGESETVIVVRESHWAVGWVEWIAIHEGDQRALQIADELQAKLQSYPVLDEDDFCQRGNDAAGEVWLNCYDWQSRVKYIRANRSQFDFHDIADMLACVRGNYFAGYASELLT